MKNLKKLTASVLSIGLVLSPVSQISHAEGESLLTKTSKVDISNEYMNEIVNEVNDIMKKCEKAKNNSEKHKILDAEISDIEINIKAHEALLANTETSLSKIDTQKRIDAFSFKKEFLKEAKSKIGAPWWESLTKALISGSMCCASYFFTSIIFQEIDKNCYGFELIFFHLLALSCFVSWGYSGRECVKALVKLFK